MNDWHLDAEQVEEPTIWPQRIHVATLAPNTGPDNIRSESAANVPPSRPSVSVADVLYIDNSWLHLGEIADHLIGHFVDQARRSGASWTEIGRAMGVTKQAARKRFLPKQPGDVSDPAAQTMKRHIPLAYIKTAVTAALPPGGPVADGLAPYSDESKKVLELTFREALRLGHNYIGTEHILLALLEAEPDDGVLASLGLAKPDVEAHLLSLLTKAT